MFRRLSEVTQEATQETREAGAAGSSIALAIMRHFERISETPVMFALYLRELCRPKNIRLIEAIERGDVDYAARLLDSSPALVITSEICLAAIRLRAPESRLELMATIFHRETVVITHEILFAAIHSYDLHVVQRVLEPCHREMLEELVSYETLEHVVKLPAEGRLLANLLDIFKLLLSVSGSVSEKLLFTLIESEKNRSRFEKKFDAILGANVTPTEQSLLLAIRKKHSAALCILWPKFSLGELTPPLCAQLADNAGLSVNEISFIPNALWGVENAPARFFSPGFKHITQLSIDAQAILKQLKVEHLMEAKYLSIKHGKSNYLNRIDDLVLLYIAEFLIGSDDVTHVFVEEVAKSCLEKGFFSASVDSVQSEVGSSLLCHSVG